MTIRKQKNIEALRPGVCSQTDDVTGKIPCPTRSFTEGYKTETRLEIRVQDQTFRTEALEAMVKITSICIVSYPDNSSHTSSISWSSYGLLAISRNHTVFNLSNPQTTIDTPSTLKSTLQVSTPHIPVCLQLGNQITEDPCVCQKQIQASVVLCFWPIALSLKKSGLHFACLIMQSLHLRPVSKISGVSNHMFSKGSV